MITGSIILFAVLFILIMLHEGGHLLMAKAFKVKVSTFSIGFGPRIIGLKFYRRTMSYRLFNRKPSNKMVWASGETEYRIAPILLGGFCAMDGEIKGEGDQALANKPYYQKLLIVMAGVIVNITTGFAAIASIAVAKLGLLQGLRTTCTFIYDVVVQAYIQTVALCSGAVPLARWEDIANASADLASWEGILLQFGFYSIVLGLFNALPIPALDGSYPLLWGLEKIFGKDKGRKIASALVLTGFTLLMGLQVFVVIYWIFW